VTPTGPPSSRWPAVSTVLLVVPALLILVIGAITPAEALFPDQGDVGLYLEYARQFANGSVPYRDFPFEYPPLALLPMAAPYVAGFLGPISLESYKWLFAGWEALLAVGLAVVLRRIDTAVAGQRRPTLPWRFLILTAGAALALTWRFDLFPALLAVAAVWAVLDRRPASAGVALALGALTKLFPLVLLPAAAVRWVVPMDRGALGRLVATTLVAVAAGLAPFVLLGGIEAFNFVAYQVARPLQIESVGGGLAALVGLASGTPVELSFDYSSVNVHSGVASAALVASPVLTMTGFVLLGWIGWRRARTEVELAGSVGAPTIVRLATASLLLLLATSKVLSIQYVVWLVPFAALLGGWRFWLAAALVALTMPIHPILYGRLVDLEALPILVLNLRNALLIALTVVTIVDVAQPLRRPARDIG